MFSAKNRRITFLSTSHTRELELRSWKIDILYEIRTAQFERPKSRNESSQGS